MTEMIKEFNLRDNPALVFLNKKESPQKAQEEVLKTFEDNAEDTELERLKMELKAVRRQIAQNAERKTRRLQLLFRPSLYKQIKLTAEAEGLSVNEFIEKAVQEYLK